jgi:uncharacterized protein YndB with AHSA1/START domain
MIVEGMMTADMRVEAVGAAQIRIERHFAAGVEAVVQAYLEPDKIKRWLGTAAMPMVVAEMDARPGGGFRFGWDMQDGQRMWLNGRFVEMEVAANGDHRIVHTELFDPDWTGGETVESADYLAQDGGTLMRSVITYGSTEMRDAALASGMAEGMRGSYALLDEVLTAG